jgi:hypothetical protein
MWIHNHIIFWVLRGVPRGVQPKTHIVEIGNGKNCLASLFRTKTI